MALAAAPPDTLPEAQPPNLLPTALAFAASFLGAAASLALLLLATLLVQRFCRGPPAPRLPPAQELAAPSAFAACMGTGQDCGKPVRARSDQAPAHLVSQVSVCKNFQFCLLSTASAPMSFCLKSVKEGSLDIDT